jgi:hypothetical protein
MGGAAGPELSRPGIGEREMTHTLEGRPALRRTLERCVTPLWGSSISLETSAVTAAGHRGEAGTP